MFPHPAPLLAVPIRMLVLDPVVHVRDALLPDLVQIQLHSLLPLRLLPIPKLKLLRVAVRFAPDQGGPPRLHLRFAPLLVVVGVVQCNQYVLWVALQYTVTLLIAHFISIKGHFVLFLIEEFCVCDGVEVQLFSHLDGILVEQQLAIPLVGLPAVLLIGELVYYCVHCYVLGQVDLAI